jgi:hypothetical protein
MVGSREAGWKPAEKGIMDCPYHQLKLVADGESAEAD